MQTFLENRSSMRKKILLVEDEALIALSQAKTLEKYGYEVVTAYSGKKAIEAADSDHDISLILMDIDLGEGMEGTEAAAQILNKRDIPVVFLSSHTEPEVVEKTEKISSYGYVVKNSGATVLDASIKMAFKLYEAYRSYNKRNQELYALAEELEEYNEELTSTEEELRKRETSLAESDNRFRSVLQLVPDMISIHDPDMNILYSNWRSFAEVPESKRRIHTKCYKTYRDLDEICPDCLAKTVLKTGRPLRREAELPDGMWVDIRAIPVLDKNNNVTMFVEWVRDITEQKINQKRLEHSEEKHRHLYETMSPGVVYQAADGTILSANPAAEKILALTVDQMNGKSSSDPRWKMLNEEGEEVPGSEHPAMQTLQTGKTVGPVDRAIFIPEKNEYVWLSITAIPLFHPDEEKPYQVYTTFDDITKRKRGEEKLKEKNNLLERIFDNSIDLIALTDLEGTYKIAGKAHEILGYDIEYLIGKNVMDFVHPGDIAFVKNEFAEFLQSDETRKVEYRYKRIDGEYLWFETIGTLLKNTHGIPEQILFTTRDITERKKAEDQLRESEATVRKKLEAILEPDGDIENLNLADIIDYEALQKMMEDFYSFSNIGGAILDTSGKVLVGVAWQDICKKFHRVHPETAKNCLESDLTLSSGVPAGSFKAYHCKNNMWDIVTPIEVNGKHLGNIYIGQFFHEDETIDYELFRRQARRYGFDEKEYVAALDRVPRFSREAVNSAIAFYAKLADMISSLSYSTIKLSRDIAKRKRAEEEINRQLSEKEILLKEVHHRIKNNVASIEGLLSLQAGSTDNTLAKSALQEATARVRSIRVLYEKLLIGEEYREVSIKTYAESLIDSLVAVFSESQNITIEKKIADCTLSSKIAIPLGIIINELLTNIFKYAFKEKNEGRISIELEKTGNQVSLTIEDNGMGIEERNDENKSPGFGLTIVKMLSEQLEGTFSIENENGTRSVLNFKI